MLIHHWKVLIALLTLPTLAAGQSLGEAARKEKERREKQGRSCRPITEQDLATTKGTLANDPGEPAEPSSPARPTSRPATNSASQEESQQGAWQARAAQARARLLQAQERRDQMQRAVHLGAAPEYDESGRARIYSSAQLKRLADAADAELAAAQADLERLQDEGRRAGVPAGWLR